MQHQPFLAPRVLVPFALVTLIWGSTWLVITGQLGTVPPVWSIAYRFAIAAAAMFLYARFVERGPALDRGGHKVAFACGIAQFCINFNFVYLAERHVTSGLVSLVFALLLVPNTILARIFLQHPIGRQFVAGSALALAGLALLFLHEAGGGGTGAPEEIGWGIALTLVGVLGASAANVIQAAERARSRPLAALTAWAMAYGAAINALIGLAFHGLPTIERSFVYLGGLVYLAIAASALAFGLHFGLVRTIGPGRAAYSSLLIPIIAMAFSTAFEGYRWSAHAAAGVGLVLIGLLIAMAARPAGARKGPIEPR